MEAIPSPRRLTELLVQHNTQTGEIDPLFVGRCSQWLRDLGFDVRTIDAAGVTHVLATIGPTPAANNTPLLRVAWVGHYDTVGVGSGWHYPALAATQDNGRLYGRGASDMKSGDAALIFAARDVAPLGVHSTVFLPGDEETTSAGVPALLTLCGDAPFDLCIGGEPTSKEQLGDCIKNGRRGRIAGTITLHGQAGHAAYADRTPNIIDRLPAVIAALHSPWNDGSSTTVPTTLSITNLTTDSSALNVIPGSVTLSFDARTTPGRSLDDVEREIERRLTETKVPYTLAAPKRTLSYMTDPSSAPDSPQATLVRCAQQAIKEVLGIDPRLTCDGGTSDARFLAALGVPTIEFGVPHGNMHGPDEFVEIENIERLRQVYGTLLRLYQAERAALRSR